MFKMDDDTKYIKSEYELQRERNIEALAAFMAEDEDTEELAKAIRELNEYSSALQQKKKQAARPRKRPSADAAFSFRGQIPVERRRSARLANISPANYKENEIIYEQRPIKRQRSTRPSTGPLAPIVSVESVTQEQLDNIAMNATKKVYSSDGTTCHQCRQKTLDTKTICRSGTCVGVRGYFCGPCLRNRYGEEVAEALLDPKWICPYCRGLCNCSFCQIRRGHAPTGILAPVAFQNGYKSVKDFLEDLNEHGILEKNKGVNNGKDEKEKEDKKERLLGFNDKGEYVLANNEKEKKDKIECLLGFNSKGEYILT